MLLHFLVNLILTTGPSSQAQLQNPAESTYAECEKSFGKVLDYCHKDSGALENDDCYKNVVDCRARCGAVKGVSADVARKHVIRCNAYKQASAVQQKAMDAMEKTNKKFKDKEDAERAKKGAGIGILDGLSGELTLGEKPGTVEKIKGGFSLPIPVPLPKALLLPCSFGNIKQGP